MTFFRRLFVLVVPSLLFVSACRAASLESSATKRYSITAEIKSALTSALSSDWATLQARHEADVGPLFRRASIDLGGTDPGLPTADLLTSTNRSAAASRYLEELLLDLRGYSLF